MVVIAWFVFRSPNLEAAFRLLRAMIGFSDVGGSIYAVTPDGYLPLQIPLVMAILAVVIFLFPNTQEIMRKYEPALHMNLPTPEPEKGWLQWQPSRVWGLVIGVIIVLDILWISAENEFLYFNF